MVITHSNKLSPQAVAPLTPSVSPTARQLPRQGAFLAVSKILRYASLFEGGGCEQREQTEEVIRSLQHLGWLLPQSNLRFASSLLEGAFWCGTNSNIKPALKGEVGFA